MRPDLAKCTTERPRGGRSRAIAKKYGGKVISRLEDDEYLDEYGGFRSSARHRQNNYGKTFTDQLGALRGNIRKAVGRRWDDVYSEFCRSLDRRGVSGHHIWTHLMQEVTTKTFMQDGKVMELSPRFGPQEVVFGFYVHPVTGTLEDAGYPGWRYRHRKAKTDREVSVPGMDGWFYKQIDGLWFRCTFKDDFNYKTMRAERMVDKRRSASRKEIAWVKQVLGEAAAGNREAC